jgi:hypothetical protein
MTTFARRVVGCVIARAVRRAVRDVSLISDQSVTLSFRLSDPHRFEAL